MISVVIMMILLPSSRSSRAYIARSTVRLACGQRKSSQCSSSPHSLVSQERKGTLYVHWPYCAQLCTYCNFNKYLDKSVDSELLYTCLVREFHSVLSKCSISSFTSIYFGGGTPSLAGPSLVETVLSAVKKFSELATDAEVCLEANPSSAHVTKLKEFKLAGVNRLSLGIQSLCDADLKLMNRDHTSDEGKRALKNAISVFPGRVNTDVIFGRPGQTLNNWTKELTKVIQLIDNHLSLYQLTVERGTALAKAVKNKELIMPDNDSTADMYETAVKLLDEAGLQRYEVSNFAKEGFESRHNLSYWTGTDYIGIGPGAHSRYLNSSPDLNDVSFTHTVNTLEPNAWTKRVSSEGNGIILRKQLSKSQRLEEVLATCLRTRNGLTDQIWQKFSSKPLKAHVHKVSDSDTNRLSRLLQSDLLVLDDRGLRATDKGLNVLDSILPDCMSLIEQDAS